MSGSINFWRSAVLSAMIALIDPAAASPSQSLYVQGLCSASAVADIYRQSFSCPTLYLEGEDIAGTYVDGRSAGAEGYALSSTAFEARVNYGSLGAYASSGAKAGYTLTPDGYIAGQASAGSNVHVQYVDTIRVTSSTLPIGMIIEVELTGVVQVASESQSVTEPWGSGSAIANARFGYSSENGSETVEYCGLPGQCSQTLHAGVTSFDRTIMAPVGSEVLVFGGLELGASASVTASSQYVAVGITSTMDALHTANMYLTSVTPGVVLIAQSGASYALPVPELATTGYMLLGVACLVIFRSISTRSEDRGCQEFRA